MIKLKDKLDILMRYHKYGEGIKKIAKNTGFSRNTVRECIRKFEEDKKNLMGPAPDTDVLSIIDSIVEKPTYDTSSRRKEVMEEKFIEKIRGYISDNNYKRENGLRKQCMCGQDMHEELVNLGYKGSYSTTCNYVRVLKSSTSEAFIRQVYEFGDICEFDWGTVKLKDKDGKIKEFKMAVFTSAKLNIRVAFLYMREDTQAFIDSHARFFEITKGVFKTMVYDNMRVAVAKFVGPSEKEPTQALQKLSLFYGFKFRFCNIYRGNEKGHVEKSVEFVRRKAFSCKIDYTFDEATEQLGKVLTRLNGTRIEEEKPYLLPYPGKYETAEIKECFVDKYSTITYLSNRYSVPDYLVGKYVMAKAYVKEILVLYNKEKVARHERLYGHAEWSMDIYHFIKTLSRKPGALKGSLALAQLQDNLNQIYVKYFREMPKEFIKVLQLIGDIGKEQVLTKISELSANNICVNLDNIKAVVFRKNDGIDDNERAMQMLSYYDRLYCERGEAV